MPIPCLLRPLPGSSRTFTLSREIIFLAQTSDGSTGLSNVSQLPPSIQHNSPRESYCFRPASECESVVLHALKTGYRHIDSARAYRNEQPCADAIRASGIPRSEIFFTSKVPPRSMGYEATKAAIESSFKQTGLDYIDLCVFAISMLPRFNQIPGSTPNISLRLKSCD